MITRITLSNQIYLQFRTFLLIESMFIIPLSLLYIPVENHKLKQRCTIL
ncbi:hypothetical protein NTGBS_180060 [Candidatus Nitrotoga sp. BS]|nr:hypothetical protein NTGBS_180060 [Candidatus Nitrotoga sp. BS]